MAFLSKPTRIVFLSLMIALGCKSRGFNRSSVQSDATPRDGFRSIAIGSEWSGQLLLPSLQNRSSGSVFLRVSSAPNVHKALIGQVVQVNWPSQSGSANKFRPDIRFDAKELDAAKKAGNVVPIALDGWSKVSPLESLAAARCSGNFSETQLSNGRTASLCEYNPLDRIYVRLKKAEFSAGQLLISEEPTVVAGSYLGLVTDIERAGRSEGDGKYIVLRARVFKNGQFENSSHIEFLVEESFGGRPNFTFNEINSSPAGKMGWYIHGDFDENVVKGKRYFVARAIEPRSLLKVAGSYDLIAHKEAGKKFISYQEGVGPRDEYLGANALTRRKFAQLENNGRKLRILQGSSGQSLSEINPIKKEAYSDSNSPFQLGEKGLLVHLFHWVSDATGKKDVGPLGLVTGHYSYGFYEVVREPLTGDLQFEIVYQQVYGQGPDGVISSKVSRAEYMGNFRRGWSNSIATSDVLVRTPWLHLPIDAPAGAPQAGLSSYDLLNDALALMTQAYRTGSGDGISSVTPWASCVQDSSQALFIALNQAEKLVASTRGKDFCSNSSFRGFCRIVDALRANFESNEIFVGAELRPDWIDNSLQLQIRRSSNALENGYAALASYKTALPRHAFNLFLSTMLDQGLELVLMDNVQIGGFWTDSQRSAGFTPIPATTIFNVVKEALEKARGFQLKTLTSEEFVQYILNKEGVESLEQLNINFPIF